LKRNGNKIIGINAHQSKEKQIIMDRTVKIKKIKESPSTLKIILNVIAKSKIANNVQNLYNIFF
jgi:flagellin-specific chaperone FliS